MKTLSMIRSLRYVTLFGAVALLAASCSKERTAPAATADPGTVRDETQPGMGDAKLIAGFVQYNGGSAPYTFNVYAANGCLAGRLYHSNGSNYVPCENSLETTTDYPVLGETLVCNEVTDDTYFTFQKGLSARGPGPVYYVYPTQGPSSGRKILKIQVQYYHPIQNFGGGAWFTYNPSANTWSSNATTNLFQWSYVTSMPTCPGEC